MTIDQLHIINFKSIASAECSFSSKINCFVGLNGMGKTNFLDALHYLSFVRSHLGIPDTLAVRQGQEIAMLEGLYSSHNGDQRSVMLTLRPGKKKILRRNQKEYTKLSEHIGQFPLVIISPQDYQLIQGGSDERRRFLDQLLSQQDASYMNALIQYNKNLVQRNSLLKNEHKDIALMEVIEMQMDRYGTMIASKRRQFIHEFIPIFNEYYAIISGGHERINLSYETQLTPDAPVLMEQLRLSRPKDYILGYTTHGIHKDELLMTLNGELIRKVGSEGQNKSFLISLKLAQFAHLRKDNPEIPILLMDDIFDKLDSERVERIINLVGGNEFGQIFITDTNRKYLDEIIRKWSNDYKIFRIYNGDIHEETSHRL
ncbi:DNA replication/repair protein RecF [Porphyromonas pogonae]|uniref:DNA replication/repair protein RecF n=1 Tax=Porphyromonas pogonae TaxID=867595 RepID=UPI002E7768E0|nr:DNA replication and repair protein RecF [Porphyromonas pogonae]